MTALRHQPPNFSLQSQIFSSGALGYVGLHQFRCAAAPSASVCRGLTMRAQAIITHSPKIEVNHHENRKAGQDGRFSGDQKQWYKMMNEIKASGDAVPVLIRQKQARRLTKQGVIGTLVRLKQLRMWRSIMEVRSLTNLICDIQKYIHVQYKDIAVSISRPIQLNFSESPGTASGLNTGLRFLLRENRYELHVQKICEWLMGQAWWQFGFEDYCLLMAAYGKEGHFQKAEALLEKFKGAGFKPNIAMQTGLIEAYVKNKMYDEAEYELRSLLKSGPTPTLATYITLMKAYAQDGRFQDAERVFSSIRAGGERPDGRCYNVMIHSYGKAGLTDRAYELYQEMRRLKLDVSVVTFNTLIACQKSVRDAQSVFRQMKAANVNPDVFSYTTLMDGYGKAGKTEEAQALFDEMVVCGIRPTRTTYNVLLDAYGRACQVYEAEMVMKKMRKEKHTPTIRAFTTLVHAYALSGNMEKAEEILRRMKSENVVPNEFTLSAIMAGYAAANDLEKMVKRFTEMKAVGLRPNQAAYTVMIEAWGLQGDFEASKYWFQEMLASGCEVDSRARNALMNASKSPDQLQEAVRLVESSTRN